MTKEVQPGKLDSIETRNFRKIRAHSEPRELDHEVKAELELRALKEVQALAEMEEALELAKSLRGKSAKSIELQLRASATRNLTRSRELAGTRRFQRDMTLQTWEETSEKVRNLSDVEKLEAEVSAGNICRTCQCVMETRYGRKIRRGANNFDEF